MAVSRRDDEGPDRGQRLLAYREHRNKKSHRSRVTLSIHDCTAGFAELENIGEGESGDTATRVQLWLSGH